MAGSEPTDLTEVYDAHVWDVYGFIAYRVGRREDAEDLTQQTFVRAIRAWRRFDPAKGSAKTWLIAIARNLVIDHARSSRPEHSFEERLESGGEEVSGTTSMEEEASLGLSPGLAAALSRLSERDREVIALRFGGEMRGAEIAVALDLTVANVQQILSRSLRRLRAELEEAESV